MTEYQRVEQLAVQAGYKSYQDYLRSNHWKELKERSGVMRLPCCVCQSQSQIAHHIRYRGLLNVLPMDLVGMCGECHDDFHMACRKGRKSYVDVLPPEIATITMAFKASAWGQKWKLKKQRKRDNRTTKIKTGRQPTSKQLIKRRFKRFMKNRNEASIKELATWLLDHCCNASLTETTKYPKKE